METFWTSDIHLFHKNIIMHANRPYDNVDEMNEAIIENWNSTVGVNDTIWFLGDFSFGKRTQNEEAFSRLNGRKHLIRGNHDGKDTFSLPWESQYDIHEIKDGVRTFVLCHFPLEVWHHANGGALHLHGHSHGSLQRVIPHRTDVGIDCHPEYRPFTMDEVLVALQADVEYRPVDQHGR